MKRRLVVQIVACRKRSEFATDEFPGVGVESAEGIFNKGLEDQMCISDCIFRILAVAV